MVADNALVTLEALIDKLQQSPDIVALVGTRIYTDVPQNTVFPFIAIRISGGQYDTKTEKGMEHFIRVSAFARASATVSAVTTALNLRKYIYDALHQKNLLITGQTMVNLLQDGLNELLEDDDGLTWQAITQYRCVVMD